MVEIKIYEAGELLEAFQADDFLGVAEKIEVSDGRWMTVLQIHQRNYPDLREQRIDVLYVE